MIDRWTYRAFFYCMHTDKLPVCVRIERGRIFIYEKDCFGEVELKGRFTRCRCALHLLVHLCNCSRDGNFRGYIMSREHHTPGSTHGLLT